MTAKKENPGDLLQGTLDLLILKALARGSQHGYGVAEWIHATSEDILRVEEGALYPALQPPGAARSARGRMGHFGKQPAREVLLAHGRRPQRAGARNRALAAFVRRRRANSANGIGGMMISSWLNKTILRLKALLHRRQLDRDLDDELTFHLAMRADQKPGARQGERGSGPRRPAPLRKHRQSEGTKPRDVDVHLVGIVVDRPALCESFAGKEPRIRCCRNCGHRPGNRNQCWNIHGAQRRRHETVAGSFAGRTRYHRSDFFTDTCDATCTASLLSFLIRSTSATATTVMFSPACSPTTRL